MWCCVDEIFSRGDKRLSHRLFTLILDVLLLVSLAWGQGCERVAAYLWSEMGPTDITYSVGARWSPWPAHSDATVGYLLGEQTATERISRRLLSRRLELSEYAGLAGAPDDALVDVGVLRGMIYIEMSDPRSAYRAYYFLRRAGRFVVLINDGFHIFYRELRGSGFGLHVFHRQVKNAVRLGVRRIETVAGRQRGENGYYTWPRYGFDAELSARIRRKLPAGLERKRTVLGLMASIRGRRWWLDHGETIHAVFDLAPGSRSRRSLSQYVAAKTRSG